LLRKIFIGYDEKESVAWHTMVSSIYRHSSVPIAIIPVYLKNLRGIYGRKQDENQSNEFSFSRFLVPHLSEYRGYAAYFDCDMLIREDINNLFEIAEKNPEKAVHVVKHDYTPSSSHKYLGKVQHAYPKKNWSSVILWNCGHQKNKLVTPKFVNTEEPKTLHRFEWLNENDIGELDKRWNWLVGEYPSPPKDVRNIHWTIGGPYFNEYKSVDYAEEWREELSFVLNCDQFSES
jgi:lipopolysaccharide biosynthesis glycosyltransferase